MWFFYNVWYTYIDMNTKKILIVEDELPIAKVLSMKLAHEGYEVDVAYEGQECLDKARSQPYDLIVLDLIMPVLDGFAVLESLKKEGIKSPVIIASNLSQPGDAQRCQDLGAVDFFIKSNTSLVELVERIADFLKN